MKKISIVLLLIVAVVLVSCNLETKAGGGQKTPKELAEEANQLAIETEKAFKALKTERDTYNKELKDAKTAYDALTSKSEVSIPTQVKKVQDKDKIHASLGYDNGLIKKLDESIKALQLGSGDKHTEIGWVSSLLSMLTGLENVTRKILDDLLSDANLKKIENDKAKIETATAELSEFIDSRNKFIKSAKKTIEAAYTNKDTHETLKDELRKIAYILDGVTTPGEAGYCNAKLTAIEANLAALDALIKG
ncbi:hypothetical protein [Borrelia sp. RT1S]|uniref:hypothetical protein n=1 Tax=Borrelia sp. RT1S TaxID=2898580 RepID=UPI001E4FBF5D|nr:hypothetical protein [Borrelia sp. RT1S]UGQ17972.1 hypothetical protein LSO05_05930 [Borrelia sp. RT1S]